MNPKISLYTLVILTCLLMLVSCQWTIRSDSHIDPSFNSKSLKSIAAFPMRSTAVNTGQSLMIDREFFTNFQRINNRVKFIGTSESVELLNQNNLVFAYDSLLHVFEHSGIPNVNILNKIGQRLNVDAILHGNILDMRQFSVNTEYGGIRKTSLSLRYTLLCTKTGRILWDGSCHAEKSDTKQPTYYEVAQKANSRMIRSIPKLSY